MLLDMEVHHHLLDIWVAMGHLRRGMVGVRGALGEAQVDMEWPG